MDMKDKHASGSWLSSADALALLKETLGMGSLPTLRRWADSGQIRTTRTPGNQRLYWADDILALGRAVA
jgi:predicted site-specific integrase-resolvase